MVDEVSIGFADGPDSEPCSATTLFQAGSISKQVIGRPDVAVGHHKGQAVTVHPGFAQIPGTGDLWTTTADLVGFSQALRSGVVIVESTAAQLWSTHASLDPPSADSAEALFVAQGYGYGTFLGRIGGQRARFHPGDNPGYQSLLAYLPERDLDLVALGNEDDPGVQAVVPRLTRI